MGVQYLKPTGILDAEVGRSLLTQIQSNLNEDDCKVFIDCSDIQFINEEGLTFLIQALEAITKKQGYLGLFAVNESVQRFFFLKGLDLIFDLYP